MSNEFFMFTIEGRLPGMNEYTEKNRYSPYEGAKMKKNSQEICEAYIRRDMGRCRINRKIKIHYTWYEKNKRRDLDNISGFGHKVIQDALVACGIIRDDGWNNIIGFTDTFIECPNNPRIEVIIEEV